MKVFPWGSCGILENQGLNSAGSHLNQGLVKDHSDPKKISIKHESYLVDRILLAISSTISDIL